MKEFKTEQPCRWELTFEKKPIGVTNPTNSTYSIVFRCLNKKCGKISEEPFPFCPHCGKPMDSEYVI